LSPNLRESDYGRTQEETLEEGPGPLVASVCIGKDNVEVSFWVSICSKVNMTTMKRSCKWPNGPDHRENGSQLQAIKFKALFDRAVSENLISKNPCNGIRIKTTKTLPKFLTVDELRKLLATPLNNTQTSLY
jgi:site-specific recombinase XerC